MIYGTHRILRDPAPPSGGTVVGPPAEAGAIDNRLSLDPNDTRWQKLLNKWDDGGEYTVTMTISQISPGEFEVKSMKAAPDAEAEAPEPETADDTGYDDGGDKGNPAVQKLMD